MITIRHKGDLSKTTNFLKRSKNVMKRIDFEKFGRQGVAALASATPVETGETASSWYYTVTRKEGITTISFSNRHMHNGVPIAIILQYGHGTRNGGWVEGRDYINPAIQPVFDKLTNDAWEEVTKVYG